VCETLNKKKIVFNSLLPATCVQKNIFYFQLVFCVPQVLYRLGRHVPLFTSKDKFEARRINITTFQDSQDEISELTSKF